MHPALVLVSAFPPFYQTSIVVSAVEKEAPVLRVLARRHFVAPDGQAVSEDFGRS
jgi:hypothetical protein